MAVDPSRELAFVANQGSVSVSIVDYRKGIVLDEVPVGERPSAILLHQNGRFLAVAETGADAIRYLHANTLATLSVQQAPDRPYGLSFTPDYQHLLVTHLLNGTVSTLPKLPYTKFLPILAFGSTETRLQQDPGSSADAQTGAAPAVSYWKPTILVSDNRIPALAVDTSTFAFLLPQGSGAVQVTAELRFRRLFAALMQQKEWQAPDIIMAAESKKQPYTPQWAIYVPLLENR